MESYVFYFDESFHDRKIRINDKGKFNVLREDAVENYIEIYEHLINGIDMDNAIVEAETEYAAGAELLDAREALAFLRRKHFG